MISQDGLVHSGNLNKSLQQVSFHGCMDHENNAFFGKFENIYGLLSFLPMQVSGLKAVEIA